MSDNENEGSDSYEDDSSSSDEDSSDDSSSESVGERPLGMCYEKSTVSHVRMSSTLQEERRQRIELDRAERAVDPGVQSLGAADLVRKLLVRRFGTCTRGWRDVLDKRGMHRIGHADFFLVMRELGFMGSAMAAWCELSGANPREISSPKQRHVTLADLDASAAALLSAFYRHFRNEVGRLSDLMANCDGLRLGEAEFITRCGPLGKKHFDREAVDLKAVFKNIHTNGAVTVPDLDWLQDYCTRERRSGHGKSGDEQDSEIPSQVLSLRDDELQATASVRHPYLLKKSHTSKAQVQGRKARPTKRQRAVKQPEPVVRVSEEAKSEKKELLRLLEERFESPMRAWPRVLDPKHKGKVPTDEFLVGCAAAGFRGSRTKLLEELGLETGASVHLKHIAPDVIEECQRFKQMASGKLSSVVKSVEARQATNPKKTALELKLKSFKKICERIGYDGSAEKMFAHLDLGGEGALSSKLLKSSDGQNKEPKGLPSLQQLKEKQDELLRKGREKYHASKSSNLLKKDFLSHLEKNVGSVPRAWRLAFDPENRGEVEPEAFIEGLAASGYLDPEGDEELQKARSLFELFADEETGAIALESFDPRTTRAIYEFRVRLQARFGGVWEAFLAYDPEGTGVVSSQAIRHMCHEARATAHIRRLLEYLDPDGEGQVSLELIDAGAAQGAKVAARDAREAKAARQREDEKKGRAHMLTKPAPVGVVCGVDSQKEQRERETGRKLLTEFKRRLTREHGSLVRAWRKVLEPAANGETLGFRAFEGVFKATKVKGDAQLAWKALERKGSKGLTLEEFDPGLDEDFRELRNRLVERYGSIEKAFDTIDTDESYALDFAGFANICCECQFRRNERRLFAYLDEEGSKQISFETIDSTALENVRQKRARDAEREAAEAAARGESAPKPPAQPEQTLAPEAVGQSGRAVRSFREHMQQRFGSMVRAWHMLDTEGKVTLTKQEFVRAVKMAGYAGNPSAVFAGLGGEEHRWVSLRELDPHVFQLLADFHDQCDEHIDGLLEAFLEAGSDEPTKRLSRSDFQALCKKIHYPKTAVDHLFQQLDVQKVGSITWEEVRFLEENWEWDPEPHPLRRKEGSPKRPPVELPGSPTRADGMGHMCTSMRPRIVGAGGLSKASSLPALMPPLRDNWNDRHHVLDASHNKDIQLLHLVTTVFTKDRERIKRNVARKMQEVSTLQWLEQQAVVDGGEEEDGE